MTSLYHVTITLDLLLPAEDRADARDQAKRMVTSAGIERSEHETNPPAIMVGQQGIPLDDEEVSTDA